MRITTVLTTSSLLGLALTACDANVDDASEAPSGTSSHATDLTDVDSDDDGLSDAEEANLGTDPANPDTDDDGWLDGDEVAQNTDPKDEWDHPYQGGWAIDDCRWELNPTGNDMGQVAENFGLYDQHGDLLKLHDFCDRAVLLVASAEWCGPCREEAPILGSWYEELADEGLMVITLLGENTDFQPTEQANLEEWASMYTLGHPVVSDPVFSVASRFVDGVIGLPSTQLLGPGAVVLLRDTEVTEADVRDALGI